MSFTHLILTRFNLATPGREHAIRNRPGWLAERFDLFERICLPSVASQTCRDFRWVIYFDKDTPEPFRSRIEELRQVVPFTPYFTGLFRSEGWNRSVGELFPDRTPYLLTTRLDNDDALAVDYVERVQEAVRGREAEAPLSVNITQGYVRSGPALYQLSHPSNAFFSRFCAWNADMVMATSILHMDIANRGPVIQLGGPGGWLQVVHGSNVSNRVRGRRISAEGVAPLFFPGALTGVAPVGRAVLTAEVMLLEPLRRARDSLLALRAGRKA